MQKPELHEDLDPQETREWIEALDHILEESGPDRVRFLINRLHDRAAENGAGIPSEFTTPYLNTIPVEEEIDYPGDRQLERTIKNIIRWNAMAMVVRANKHDDGIGGHISSYQSLATLVEVGYNHFFRAAIGDQPGDQVYFQGHVSPGMYSRAFVEGRLTEEHLKNFRHELREHPGLSSYPHPWLMPDFWQYPTVSMGLGPINSIYHARFIRYMENRGLIEPSDRKVWAFVGDGESDEPETLGALTLASREHLDNLIWVVNCNLQRLDGPVRGNGKIIQELEGAFRGAGWNVIKVIWGADWDEMLDQDVHGLLRKRMEECVDGEYQRFKGLGGKVIRDEFFGKYPELLAMVEDMSDEEVAHLRRGGHDPHKVFNAYHRAMHHKGQPTVILAKTVKGYGLGEAGEGKNITHQQKKLNQEELEYFRQRFDIPVHDSAVEKIDFCRLTEGSEEEKYLHERRKALGGYVPERKPAKIDIKAPPIEAFKDSLEGSRGREVSTTMAFVAVLKNLLTNKELGKYIVPIIPDEGRTFGMESLFRSHGIYASQGQLYEPVDSAMLLYYKEAKDGQILEEGITEAGSMASFTAAGTAYANYGIPMIPFFIYYSMFGFQRIGDQIWAFGDSRGKGFLCGGTAGRTTLNGEGLQHEDGHSLVTASTVPNCVAYDAAFAYEVAVIVRDGIRRMYEEDEDVFYYLTLENDNYVHPTMEEGIEEGILKGIYRYKAAENGPAKVQLWGSGAILNEAVKAQALLAEKYDIAADVWSVTSYTELRRDALEVERWNRLHPSSKPRTPYVVEALAGSEGPVIAASDYMKALPDGLSQWLPGRITSLGTDGYGRSESREYLRRFFEVDSQSITAATLAHLAREGNYDKRKANKAIKDLGLDPELPNPALR